MRSRADVLVVGSGGFVGSRLVPELRRRGFEVACATHRPRPGAGELAVDVGDRASVAALFAAVAPRAVVHLAAIAHHRPAHPGEYDRVNHHGVRHVLDACGSGVERLVVFSSASVYGAAGRTGPVREDDERRPVTPYAQSKARAEDACFAAAGGGPACVVLRPCTVYASGWLLGVRKRVYVPGSGGRLLLRVPGRQPRFSLCAVVHTCDAVELALRGALPPGAYNVSDGEPYLQCEVAAAMDRDDGRRLRVVLPRAGARAAL
ncbi:MAG TPA: NAD(P)-dependent oxidoreductase, partial [Longimicrobium sp.]|nr:NAD(P)-dependent oxidoreductase [Longimicrobium sp.]